MSKNTHPLYRKLTLSNGGIITIDETNPNFKPDNYIPKLEGLMHQLRYMIRKKEEALRGKYSLVELKDQLVQLQEATDKLYELKEVN